MNLSKTPVADERTQLKVGQPVVVDGKWHGEITETMLGDGGFYRVEVDAGKEKHEFWTVDFDRMEVIPSLEERSGTSCDRVNREDDIRDIEEALPGWEISVWASRLKSGTVTT